MKITEGYSLQHILLIFLLFAKKLNHFGWICKELLYYFPQRDIAIILYRIFKSQ